MDVGAAELSEDDIPFWESESGSWQRAAGGWQQHQRV